MKTIKLTQGKVALVDDCEYGWLIAFRWFAMNNGRHWCAARNAPKSNGKRGTIYMHRELMNFPDCEVDHRDGNALNNQRSNLRLANDRQQAAHRWCPPNASGYRGVVLKNGRFEARINEEGRYLYLGRFDTRIDAAKAYDAAAKAIHGQFAVLNFP